MPEAQRRRALTITIVVVFFDMAGAGLIVPVMPGLLKELTGRGTTELALISGSMLFLYAAMQLLFAPLLGRLSDAFGRRVVLLGALLGLSIDYAILATAPSLALLFVGRAVAGICGASIAPARAVAADITAPNDRAKTFGLISAAGGMGLVVGPVIGGLLAELGTRTPFWISGVLVFATFVWAFFMLPETLEAPRRRPLGAPRARSSPTQYRESRALLILAVIFLMQLAAHSLYSVWAFFMIETLNWSALLIGLSMSMYGGLFAIVQAGLVGRATRRFGEQRLIIFSLLVGAMVYAALSMAQSTIVVFLLIAVGSLAAFATPALQSLLSKQADERSQGQIQGALSATLAVTAVIGPLVMTGAFAIFSDDIGVYWPGAPFVLAAVFVAAALAVFVGLVVGALRRQSQGGAT